MKRLDLLAVTSRMEAGAVSLRDLDASASGMKRALAQAGFKDGDRVTIMLTSDLEKLVKRAK